VDKTGKWIINPQYEKVRDFNNGRAMIRKNGVWGWINKTGSYLINPQFPNAFPFVKVE